MKLYLTKAFSLVLFVLFTFVYFPIQANTEVEDVEKTQVIQEKNYEGGVDEDELFVQESLATPQRNFNEEKFRKTAFEEFKKENR